ncbi:MAG: hypothetical protein DDT23_01248 [candidate division WS2 bacterium]|nr:hypothetical protein [Candidatus Lithacetigena glycinireducens]
MSVIQMPVLCRRRRRAMALAIAPAIEIGDSGKQISDYSPRLKAGASSGWLPKHCSPNAEYSIADVVEDFVKSWVHEPSVSPWLKLGVLEVQEDNKIRERCSKLRQVLQKAGSKSAKRHIIDLASAVKGVIRLIS